MSLIVGCWTVFFLFPFLSWLTRAISKKLIKIDFSNFNDRVDTLFFVVRDEWDFLEILLFQMGDNFANEAEDFGASHVCTLVGDTLEHLSSFMDGIEDWVYVFRDGEKNSSTLSNWLHFKFWRKINVVISLWHIVLWFLLSLSTISRFPYTIPSKYPNHISRPSTSLTFFSLSSISSRRTTTRCRRWWWWFCSQRVLRLEKSFTSHKNEMESLAFFPLLLVKRSRDWSVETRVNEWVGNGQRRWWYTTDRVWKGTLKP